MQLQENHELLQAVFVGLDPLVGTGVLVEIHRRGNEYVLLETAPATGNRLLKFTTKDRLLAETLFLAETRAGNRSAPGEEVACPATF